MSLNQEPRGEGEETEEDHQLNKQIQNIMKGDETRDEQRMEAREA